MLFKSENNNQFEEIKAFLPLSVASDFGLIAPFIEEAESEYIEPMLGSALYNHLLSFYGNPDQTVAWLGENKTKWTALLKKVQRSLINLAYWTGFDLLNVSGDSAGFHREETERRKGLYRYQEENLKTSFRNAGFNGQDKVMAYLEANISVFEDFKSSTYYTFRKASIIPTTEIFNAIYPIGMSRLVMLKLRRFIEEAEVFTLQSVLGKTLYDKVKSEIAKDSPAAEITALLPYIRPAIVYLSMARGLNELGVNFTDRSVFLEYLESTLNSNLAQKPLADSQLGVVINATEKSAGEYIARLKAFLISDPDKYPEYSGQVGSVYARDNTDKKTLFV